ncbi:MAG: divalent-cation tolerance protein CutA [Gammaproteobacteria bacterium]|nr:MAG: divalent-cation tolerance protein CutA [Gammaproteobacteria bacterium]
MEPFLLVFNTCPDEDTARRIARTLVEQRLAACVNILPGLSSIYAWKGDIEEGEECLLLIKTREEAYGALEKTLQSLHPYELPEIVAVPIAKGLPPYLQWIQESTSP